LSTAAAAAGSAAPRLLPAGAANVGEVQIRGPQVRCSFGYHGNAAATAEALVPGGWFRMGDLTSASTRTATSASSTAAKSS